MAAGIVPPMLLLAVALGTLSVAVAVPGCSSLLAHPPSRLIGRNFRGRDLPVVGGLVLLAALLAGEMALSAAVIARPGGAATATFRSRDHWGLLIVALGFFALGLLDDLAGAAGGRARGLRGHFRALVHGRVTTGAVKALGGAVVALAAGAVWERHLGPALLDAALVALSANLVNLLDLRPGRAVKVFLVCWVGLAAAAWGSAYVALSLPVVGAAVVWMRSDLAERGMLGDVGANLLGAVLGAGVALSLGVPGRLGVLGVLVILTAASERWSFSAVIDSAAPLRWLDHLGRLDPPEGGPPREPGALPGDLRQELPGNRPQPGEE